MAQLAGTAGAEVVGRLFQNLDHAHPRSYLGSGKLQELTDARSQTGYTLVVFDDELSPLQQRSLEEALQVKVLDRTALILDIFSRQARTREGRLQVELAQHQYLLPRLAGQWSHLERLGGGIGTRGPGESQLETDRRLIRQRIERLQQHLEEVRKHRALYRRQRSRKDVPVVSLVGYTNAGKSTLFNALTSAGVRVQDKLFSTLDPVTRQIRLPGGGTALLTDTVGFIQKLPHSIVAAFRATLEELEEADLLVHVIDITHGKAAEQSQVVENTLAELGLQGKMRVLALNKIDLLELRGEAAIQYPPLVSTFPATLVSAARGLGLDELRASIERALEKAVSRVTG